MIVVYSHLGASVTFTMPFTFSFEEYADMIYVYGFCDGNSDLAVAQYQRRFPINEGVKEEGIVRMVHRSPRASTRRIARRLRVPHTRVWRTLHAEGMYPYHV